MAPSKATVSGALRGMARTLELFETADVVIAANPEAAVNIGQARHHLEVAAEAVESVDETELWGDDDGA